VFYPLQTFTKEREIIWSELPICIEANSTHDLEALLQLTRKLSIKVSLMGSEDRRWLHLAAVFVNNFTNHLLNEASNIVKERNLDFDLLRPLALETIKKAFDISPENAQTGPAKRGDEATMRKHIDMLQDNTMKELYSLLSDSIKKRTGI
jgi:predicted short-subunit dehydrogenase-like oxidoreductase (DUF2520 family)